MRDGGFTAVAKDASFSIDQIKKKMKELKEAQESGGKGDAGSGGIVKDLRESLGAKSTFGQIAKILKGGGAVLGVSILAGEIDKAAKAAKDLTQQYNAGTISGAKLSNELLKQIPIFGEIYAAADNVYQVLGSFDGLAKSGIGKLFGLDDLNYAQKINKELEVTKGVDDYIEGSLGRQKTLLTQVAEAREHIAVEAGKVALEGNEQKRYEMEAAASERLAAVEKKRRDALDESDKKRDEAMSKLRADKDMSPAMAFRAEQQLQKAANEEKKKINADFNSENSDTEKLNDAERLQFHREHQEKIDAFEADAARETADRKKDAQAKQLRDLGDSLGAELVLIQKNAKDKKDEIAKSLKEQLKGAIGDDAEMFKKAAAAQSRAVDDDAAEAAALARKTQQESVVKTLQDGQVDALKHAADAGDEAAEAELKRLEAARANNDAQKKLLDLLKQQLTPAERAVALAQLAALKTADHAGVVKQLEDQKSDALRAEAENGATFQERRDAQKQLEVLELKKKYNQEARKTAEIINNPNATAADKAAATANLKAYAATLGKEFDKSVGLDKRDPLKKTADLQERGLLVTGVAAAARAKADPQERIARNSDEAVKLQSEANAAFEKFATWQKQQESRRPVVVFGVSDGR